jgi:Protein of unknown function (DUF4232)
MVAGCGAHPLVPKSAAADYVPWLPLSPTKALPQAPTPSPAPPVPIPMGTQPCKAAQLEGALVGSSAATGHINAPIALRNNDTSACYLEGSPDLTILDGAGKILAQAVGAQRGETFFDDGPVVQVLMPPGTPPLPTNLTQGQQASRGQGFVNVEWYDCRGTLAAQMSINLPNGGGALTIAYHFQAPYSPVCDGTGFPTVSLLRGPVSPAGYVWPPGPVYVTVNVAISAPVTARHGSTLVYFVTLTNTSATDYVLDLCPDYGEFLGGKKAFATYRLNCAPAGHIGPGSSVRFEMHLDLPGDLVAGTNQLTWALYDERLAMPVAQAAIDIT